MRSALNEYHGVILQGMAVPVALFLEREQAQEYATESGGSIVAFVVSDGTLRVAEFDSAALLNKVADILNGEAAQ